MADTGTRYRLVTRQGDSEHVHAVVMNHQEAEAMLEVERDMHEQTGWHVATGKGIVTASILVGGGRVSRTITIRAFTPLDDVQT